MRLSRFIDLHPGPDNKFHHFLGLFHLQVIKIFQKVGLR
jgi:hypothetical protein